MLFVLGNSGTSIRDFQYCLFSVDPFEPDLDGAAVRNEFYCVADEIIQNSFNGTMVAANWHLVGCKLDIEINSSVFDERLNST